MRRIINDFLKIMDSKGIIFTTTLPYGYGNITLKLNEINNFIKDPHNFYLKWMASFYGISLSQLIKWSDFVHGEECQCRGITRKNKRCKFKADFIHPSRFNENIDCYCKIHSRLGGN